MQLIKTVLYGALFEGVLAFAIFGGAWGPCGPGTIFGQLGILLHIFPGFLTGGLLYAIGGNLYFFWSGVLLSQYLFWLGCIYIIRKRFRGEIETISTRPPTSP